VKPVAKFVKEVVDPVVSTKRKIQNVSGDVLRKVLPGPLGQFVNEQRRHGEQSVT